MRADIIDEQMIEYLVRNHTIEQLAGKLVDSMTSGSRRQLKRETEQFFKDNAHAAVLKRAKSEPIKRRKKRR